MATRLALRIQERYEALTASEKKIATLLLDRPDEILTFSATELAGLAGVSKATAARFFRSLGYSDFNDVRLQAREERNRTGPVHQVPMPAEPPEGAAPVPVHLQVEMANLTRTFEELRSDLLAGVAERLAAAQRVWVAGLGPEGGLARHARIDLARVRPAVHLVSENTGSWAEELASTGPADSTSPAPPGSTPSSSPTRPRPPVPGGSARRRSSATSRPPLPRPRTPPSCRCSTSSPMPSPPASARRRAGGASSSPTSARSSTPRTDAAACLALRHLPPSANRRARAPRRDAPRPMRQWTRPVFR